MTYFLPLITTLISLCLCSFLSHHLLLPPPLAISILGFLGTFYSHQGKVEKGDVQAYILMGAFAGASRLASLDHSLTIVAISILIPVIYKSLRHVLVGIGGKLGFISFLSCLILFLFNYFFHGFLP